MSIDTYVRYHGRIDSFSQISQELIIKPSGGKKHREKLFKIISLTIYFNMTLPVKITFFWILDSK